MNEAQDRIWVDDGHSFITEYIRACTHREELAQVWDAVAYLCREGLDIDTIRETAERAAAAQRAGAEK